MQIYVVLDSRISMIVFIINNKKEGKKNIRINAKQKKKM